MPVELPTLSFPAAKDWQKWLDKNHSTSAGVMMRIAKKGVAISTVSHPEALDVALCYGWIDGLRKGESDETFLQKFTPRAKRSLWSKINREKVLALIATGHMKPAGLAEIERAKKDGRWEAAYEAQSKSEVPPDLQAALDRNAKAKAFFATLSSQNRYAVLLRIHIAKKAETRARRIETFVAMLERGETLHP